MGSNTPCHFCMQLPVAPSARPGRTSNCPLCKSTILEGAGGAFLVVESGGAAKSASKRALWFGAAAGLVLSAALLFWHFQRETTTDAPKRSDTPVAGSSLPLGQAKPMAVAYPVALVKDSSLQHAAAAGQAKPQTYPVPPPPVRPTGQVKRSETTPIVVAKAGLDRRAELAIARLEADRIRVQRSKLREQLERVREVTLVGTQDAKKELGSLAEKAGEMLKKKDNQDAFIQWIKDERPELAGLPYLLGHSCRLTTEQARHLQQFSIVTRQMLKESSWSGTSSLARTKVNQGETAWEAQSKVFWEDANHVFSDERDGGRWNESRLGVAGIRRYPDSYRVVALPALMQILGPSEDGFRKGIVQFTASIKKQPAEAAVALARHAIFDHDPEIRAAAVEALRLRPKEQYLKVLLEGLQYPWAPVVKNTAEAVVSLQRSNSIPKAELSSKLSELLDRPSPDAPFIPVNGDKPMVRELVRINHHRNCMLCHATAAPNDRAVAVQVPSPDEPLPPSFSFEYYNRGRSLAIRPDVTYLRQDFSLMQMVEDHRHWPAMQRFDFLVRTRLATSDEVKAWEARKKVNEISEHRQAILWALREIGGTPKK